MGITVFAILTGLVFFFYTPRFSWVRASLRFLVGGFCFWAALVFGKRVLDEGLILGTGLSILCLAALLLLTDLLISFSCWCCEKAGAFFRKTPKVPAYVTEIWTAMERMASRKTGSLIILQRKQPLRPQMKGGMPFDAEIKADILVPLFLTTSPVHDGALVVYKGRIQTVKGILPLASLTDLAPNFGTRHRAAIGITEKRMPSRSSSRKNAARSASPTGDALSGSAIRLSSCAWWRGSLKEKIFCDSRTSILW